MKKTIRCILGLFLFATAMAAHAQYLYTTNNGTITITGYTGFSSSVTIPTNINGLTVMSIGSNAFQLTPSLNSITIPGSVTNIEDNAFNDCVNLSSVTIGSGVISIGNDAFNSCNFSSITIPNSVTSIGDGAFAFTPLTSATIPSGVTNLGENPFAGCVSLGAINVATNNPAFTTVAGVLFNKVLMTLIGYPSGKAGASYAITNTVTLIGSSAFDDCTKLSSISIPASVAVIGNSAFFGCSGLTNIAIPYSVTNIGTTPFANCTGLTAFAVDTNNPAYISVAGVLLDQDQTTLVAYPAGSSLTSYAVPSGVTNIPDFAFSGCASLTNVIIPNIVTNIGSSAFAGSGLTSLAIPTNVTTIGNEAFVTCSSLRTVAIPASVTSIGINAFYGCVSLTNLTIPSSITSIGSAAFGFCSSLTSVTIPAGITNFRAAFLLCNGLTNVTFANGLANIEEQAFGNCANLTEVTVPASVTNIADYAFAFCPQLSSLYFQGNAPSADSSIFLNDSGPIAYYLPGAAGWSNTFGGIPTALWIPAIRTTDGFFGVQNHQFGFNISWASNYSVTVQASPNPVNPTWTPLTNVTLTNGLFYFTDAGWTNYPGRYYRVSYP